MRFLLQDHPDLVKDQFWDEDRPEMPYTLASEEIKLRHVPAADSTALFEVVHTTQLTHFRTRISYDNLNLIDLILVC